MASRGEGRGVTPLRPASDGAAAVPSLPSGPVKLDGAARTAFASAFRRAGAEYDAVRPGYPDWVVDFLVPDGARDAVDVGAGTGLFTRMLVERGLRVRAVEPADSMRSVLARALPDVAASGGTAEATGLAQASADVVTVAQAWHWVDASAASAEAARILRAGGVLGLVWNQLDVEVPWVHRLARIMHSGDVQRDERAVAGVDRALFNHPELRTGRWEDTASPEELVRLCHSRSYWLRASAAVRERVDANLAWYLYEHLGLTEGERVGLPYVSLAARFALR